MERSMTDAIVILVTAGSEAEAEIIAKAVVEEQLAACVNILSPIRSIYRWEGKVADDREWLLLIKSRAERFAAVETRVKALHSYQMPEVIALPIVAGADGYMRWLRESVSKP
jgi:periplasmic divalent cation tolerance protein